MSYETLISNRIPELMKMITPGGKVLALHTVETVVQYLLMLSSKNIPSPDSLELNEDGTISIIWKVK